MEQEAVVTEINLSDRFGKRFFVPYKRYDRRDRQKNLIVHKDYDKPRWIVAGRYADEGCRRIKRAGCIFYTIVNNDIYFCFGRDRKSRDLTDFGGQRKRDEDFAICASREATEETLGIFGTITPDTILHYPALYNREMYISFVRVGDGSEDIRQKSIYLFNDKHQQEMRKRCLAPEVSAISWHSLNDLKESLGDSPRPGLNMYRMVRRFLCSGFQVYDKDKSFFNLELLQPREKQARTEGRALTH